LPKLELAGAADVAMNIQLLSIKLYINSAARTSVIFQKYLKKNK